MVFDARLHFQNVKRLGHIVVRAVFQTQYFVDMLAFGRQHDDGDVGMLANPLAHRDAVKFRQHYVQENEIKLTGKELCQRFLAIRR